MFTLNMLILFAILSSNNASSQCELISDLSIRSFHKVKTCYRSSMPVISRIQSKSLLECMDFAKERGGLAINFSPPGASVSEQYQDNFLVNCNVLACPETLNSSTLVNDTAFDYYSYFGNLDMLQNTLCIKTVGLFRIIREKFNYTTAITKCQEIGGDLAHVASEARTNGISSIVKEELKDWYSTAYIGLDDIQKEGFFETALGEPLTCFKFRAWGPGQPRSKAKQEDCVIIDLENVWKVVNCKQELPAVCELYPMAPYKTNNVNCSLIKDIDERKKCRSNKKNNERNKQNKVTTANDRCIE